MRTDHTHRLHLFCGTLLALAAACAHAESEDLSADAQKHVDLARYVAGVGDYERAAVHIAQALREEPQSKSLHFTLGALHQKTGNYPAAAETYRRLIQRYPEEAEAHLGLGNVYLVMRRPDDAIESFQRAVELEETLAEAHRNLGYVYLQTGREREAVASLREAIMLEPRDALCYYDMGMAYFALGRTNAACAAFAKGLELSSTTDGRLTYTDVLKRCAWDRFVEGKEAYRRGDFDAAIGILSALERAFPDFAPASAYLGHAYTHRRPSEPEKATDAYQRALDAAERYVLHPEERAFVLDNLGMISMNAGDFDAAHAYFARAVDLGTDYPVAYFNFGCVLAHAERYTEASVAFADAARRDEKFLGYVAHHAALGPFRATVAYSNLVQSFQND